MNKSLIISIAVLAVLGAIMFYVLGPNDEAAVVPQDPNDSQVAGASTGGCFVGGCSSQICSEDPEAASTCEYKEEYACYAASKCERQATGQCGWTPTPEFNICMNSVLYPGADMK